MIVMKRRLSCCNGNREISMDFDAQQGIMTYNGLESYMLNGESYHDNESCTSRGDECVTNSFDEDEDNSSSSSSNDASASFSSLYTMMKNDDHFQKHEWNSFPSPTKQHLSVKENQYSDIETMKEKFSKLLLGEDTAGGSNGISSALAISNAISTLATSVFGELWKLEPLSDERKGRWRREMDWLLSPTFYMIELVPAKQNGSNGRIIEIMTPKARADIHMNLPALRKLDSMLIETLDSMIGTEFWYAEVGSRAEGSNKSAGERKRWWLPSPVVPKIGLSEVERKRLLHYGKLVYQVFKAAKSINENVLDEMAVPTIIKDALPKSGKANIGGELYGILTSESTSVEKMIERLNLKSEHGALEAINRLEAALFVWKETIAEYAGGKPQIRTLWSFVKDKSSEIEKVESLVNQAEMLLQQLKIKYPDLPQTFLDITKIQYGKDLGHAILEAYSRVVANLAFKILSRIGDILEEDITSNPNSPIAISQIVGARISGISDSPMLHDHSTEA